MESCQRRDEALEILTEWTAPIFGIIPVWISVPIALMGWVIIYFYWTMKVSAATPLNELGLLLGAGFAGVTLSAGYRGFQFRQNRGKFVASRAGLSVLKNLNEQDFTKVLANYHRLDDCTVEELAEEKPDRGIDLVILKNGQKTIVQCRHWQTGKIGVAKVRELFGIQAHEKADKAVLITRGVFTESASSFASGKPMELIDGAQFAELARQLQNAFAGTELR